MKASRLVAMASDVVAATQREFPREILDVAKLVPVRFEPAPSAELVAEGIEPDTLGLFTGSPHGSPDSGGEPARIGVPRGGAPDVPARTRAFPGLGRGPACRTRPGLRDGNEGEPVGTSANPRFPSRHHPVLNNQP